jgi:hypothetical protein
MPRKSTKPAKSRAAVPPAADGSPPDQTEVLVATSQSANDQRDSRGRFTEGNAGGPGNPHARHCARMLEMFRNSITDEEMYGLCRVLFERASGGDMGSLKMIWQYKLGKPLPAPNPDMIDRDEWDHFQKDAMTLDEMRKVLGQLPSRIGNDIVSAALPSIASTISHSLAQQLLQGLPAEYLGSQSNGPANNEPIPTAGSNGLLPAEPTGESSAPATLHTPLATHPSSGSNGFLPAEPPSESPSPATLHTPLATRPSSGSNGFLPAEPPSESPSPGTLNPPPATHSHPIPNGFLPALDADGLPVRTMQPCSSAADSEPISNGNSKARHAEQAATPPSRSTRHSSPATRSSSPATLHPPLTTRSAPIPNGKSKTGCKGKKARKSARKQWLEPIARKCQASKKPKQRLSA